MRSGFRLSRRALLQTLIGQLVLGGLGVRRAAAAPPDGALNGTPQLLQGFRRAALYRRRYRVDATVLLCDLPIFTRKNVGGGYAGVETGAAGDSTAVALQFAAGSWPSHAGGLNRFGILREAVVTRPSADPEFFLSGLITASKEEDIGEARKALNSSTRTAQVILARGQATNGRIRTWTEAAEIPLDHTWIEATSLLDTLVRSEPDAASRETRVTHVNAVTPFLAAMRCAALSSQSPFRCPFVHAGKLYSLETQRHGGAPASLAGTIRNSQGQKSADFRTFYAPGDDSGIPVRIDYRPKSFLRLVFELEPDATQPPIASMFSEENS